jgi:hypothetical protein
MRLYGAVVSNQSFLVLAFCAAQRRFCASAMRLRASALRMRLCAFAGAAFVFVAFVVSEELPEDASNFLT